jgi:transcription elongation factor Elf1
MQVEQSYFECGDCGARDRSTTVPYDWLGYPVCPSCGARTAP